jgi:hypothetical protein
MAGPFLPGGARDLDVGKRTAAINSVAARELFVPS